MVIVQQGLLLAMLPSVTHGGERETKKETERNERETERKQTRGRERVDKKGEREVW